LLWGRYTEEMGATPAGSDARMAARAAAAVDHWLLQLAPRQGPGCDQGLGMKLGLKCADDCIWCCRMGQLASNGKRRCNLRGGLAPNSTMTRSALRRHKSDAEGDDDE
jgi:hypothetical protein